MFYASIDVLFCITLFKASFFSKYISLKKIVGYYYIIADGYQLMQIIISCSKLNRKLYLLECTKQN